MVYKPTYNCPGTTLCNSQMKLPFGRDFLRILPNLDSMTPSDQLGLVIAQLSRRRPNRPTRDDFAAGILYPDAKHGAGIFTYITA